VNKNQDDCMKVNEALYMSMRRWSLKCATQFRFAIPNKVIEHVLLEFPKLAKQRKELMDEIRKVCLEVNKLKDSEIRKEIDEIFFEDTVIKG